MSRTRPMPQASRRPAPVEATRPTARSAARPLAVDPVTVGEQQLAGWLAPNGKFYPTMRWAHIRVAARLRETGDGPADPWTMRDGWVMIRSHGEVVSLPGITQAQWDALGDMLVAAPPGGYRSQLLLSLRQLRELEAPQV